MAIRLSGTRLLFVVAAIGCVAGVTGAVVSSRREPSQPPVFDPAPNPFPDGIYANGIVESDLPRAGIRADRDQGDAVVRTGGGRGHRHQ